MRILAGVILGVLFVVLNGDPQTSRGLPPPLADRSVHRASLEPSASHRLLAQDLDDVVERYCESCHNDRRLRGNMSLESFEVSGAADRAELAEKIITKLRAGMMPPAGAQRPAGDTLLVFAETLERDLDRAAAADPNPGSRTFQRLNRVEYQNSIRELLGLQIDAGAYLPPDAKSANFDNIADAQLLSSTLMDGYLRAATQISRLAVGYSGTSPSETQFLTPQWVSQDQRVEGAPFGTRGGSSVVHNFPADGEYVFRVSLHYEDVGSIYGSGQAAMHTVDQPEQIEISIDGARVTLLAVERFMHMEDPGGVTMKTEPLFVRSGSHRVTAAFIKRYEGPVDDLISPFEWSIANTATSTDYGLQQLPHLRELVIAGPYNPTGVSGTPTRERLFTCRPTAPEEVSACAGQILTRLATQAFRRPVTSEELTALLSFYDRGAAEGGFESGIRVALEAILASPRFVFRFEDLTDEDPGKISPISDFALASRLSYFLWGTSPDLQLMSLARAGELSDERVLVAQARRMLADPRSEALGSRFLAQWLRLPDLEGINPDVRVYPDFDQQLRQAMRLETETFFNSLLREDRGVLELFTADYTFVNERLARHYGIPGVAGDHLRRVSYPDENRVGILGHASVLTLTSMPGRTSPVLRGKWVMEVILGTPPPAPPPNVPALEATPGDVEGRILTTRERLEQHRASPVCNSCHRFMDPIGLALDNFDVTGRWRARENGVPLDIRGELYDGTPVTSPSDLHRALFRRSPLILRNFTSNLMTYALGRRVEYYDQPTVRRIVEVAASEDYRISSFILEVVKSDAFRMQASAVAAESQ